MKYLFKEVGYYKGLRVFAASKGTLAKRTEKMTILDHVVRMGCFSELKAVKRGGIKTRVEDGFIKFEKDFVDSGAEFSIEVGVDVDEMSDAMMDEYFRGIDPGYGVKK
jgi:hypothetical protein